MRGPSQHPSTEPVDDLDEFPTEKSGSTILEIIVTVGAALLLAFLVQHYLVKPFRIPSGSMENTLRCNDRVLVDRISYRFGDPERQDVVVFNPPAGLDENGNPDPSQVADTQTSPGSAARPDEDGSRSVVRADVNFIKRIIGVPGDRVEIRDHRAFVNGKALDEPYLHPLTEEDFGGPLANFSITLPKGTYLMLGDNRNNSKDGRTFPPVPESFIVGKAFMVYWPPKRFGGLPARDPGGNATSQEDPNCLESSSNALNGQPPDDG